MRISTPYQYGTYTSDISQAQQRYLELQRQVSTGKRLERPSDDPLGLASTLSLRHLREGLDQYNENLTSAKSHLTISEGALGEMNTLMRRAYQLAVSGANGATDPSAKSSMVSELTEIQKRLVDLGNSQGTSGQYLFSGQMTDTKPFTVTVTGVVYNGDDLDRTVEAAPGETLVASVPGRQIFLDAHAAIESLKNHLQGDSNAISGVDIPAVQSSLDSINQLRGQVGARLQSVQQWLSDHQRRGDELSSAISDIEEVDITETIVQYQMAETAYGAALQVASQGFRLSLLDFIST